MEINVYEQYFKADAVHSGVKRNGVRVALTSDSSDGVIRCEVSVSFLPHRNETDFAVSYDAYSSVTVYEGKGRRSRKEKRCCSKVSDRKLLHLLHRLTVQSSGMNRLSMQDPGDT